MASTPQHDPPPSSGHAREPLAAPVTEDHFFKIGDAGEYEGGPSHHPPPMPIEEHELHHSIRVVRTPEQEERRARFIRWVVLAMGFGIAISTMGIVLKKVAPPPASEEPVKLVHPAPIAPEALPVAKEPATAAVIPAPPPLPEVPVPSATLTPTAEAPVPTVTTPPVSAPPAATHAAAPATAAHATVPTPKPTAAVAAPAKSKPGTAELTPGPKRTEAKPKSGASKSGTTPVAPTAPAGTASFPVD